VLELGLAEGEYPSLGFIYGVLNPLIEKKKEKRNPGQGPGIVIKTINKDKVREVPLLR
jgi:putative transposase